MISFTDINKDPVQKGIGKNFNINVARVSKNSKGGVDVYSIRTQDSWSHEWPQIEISKDHTSSPEITNEPYMSSNYENIVRTTTAGLLNNKLLWLPDEHLRSWIEKIKNLREQNFEGEANSKLLDKEDT